MPLFTKINTSLRCPQNVSVKLTENSYFKWKQKHAVLEQVSLNANELLLLAPFSRIELCHYRSYLLKNIGFGI